MAKETTLHDIVQLIQAQNLRFEQRFDAIDTRLDQMDARFQRIEARLDDMQRDISGIRVEQTKLNKLYEQLHDRVLGIENDIKEIYDRLVMLEGKVFTTK